MDLNLKWIVIGLAGTTFILMAHFLEKILKTKKEHRNILEQLETLYEPLFQIISQKSSDDTSERSLMSSDHAVERADKIYRFLIKNEYHLADIDDVGMFQNFIMKYLRLREQHKEALFNEHVPSPELKDSCLYIQRDLVKRISEKYHQKRREIQKSNIPRDI